MPQETTDQATGFSARSTPTAALVLDDGSVVWGQGLGATGSRVGELCFNTAMTGYQEILSDLSYAGQIIVFTFPHIGNVGVNTEDMECDRPVVQGCILRTPCTPNSNFRAEGDLPSWLERHGIVGISGVDTRALTRRLREKGFANAVIAHAPDGVFDLTDLSAQAARWPGLEGAELARDVSVPAPSAWQAPAPAWAPAFGQAPTQSAPVGATGSAPRRVIAFDYGLKQNIVRSLAAMGCEVTIMPASSDADAILAQRPDGILLSNGPGDPAATGDYALGPIRTLIDAGLPVFGICLGHQLLALALGAKTRKMHQGHHGANHPVKDLSTGQVVITSMNHGFEVDRTTLPSGVVETHVSLFDGSNCGLAVEGKPVFSVQYHPEASPGPHDAMALFSRFAAAMDSARPLERAG